MAGGDLRPLVLSVESGLSRLICLRTHFSNWQKESETQQWFLHDVKQYTVANA